jgi:hypothetical protein
MFDLATGSDPDSLYNRCLHKYFKGEPHKKAAKGLRKELRRRSAEVTSTATVTWITTDSQLVVMDVASLTINALPL